MNVKFSVIMPVYNAEKTVEKAIKSVLNDNNSNVELVIVNDGSTDNSETVIKKYLNDSRVSYYCQENAGVSSARNYALTVAKGEYVAFLDSDDYFEEDAFAQLTKCVDEYQCDMIGFGHYSERFSENGKHISTKTTAISQLLQFSSSESEDYLEYIFKSSKVMFQTSWNKIYRRNIIVSNDIKFDKKLVCFEDMKFVMDFIANCESIVFLKEIYYHFSRSGKTTSSLKKRRGIELTSNVSSCFSSFVKLADKYNYSNEFRSFMYEQFFADFTYCSQKVFLPENIMPKKERIRLFSEFLDDEMFLFLKKNYFGNFRFYKILYMLHNNKLDSLAYWLYKKKIVDV